MIPNRLRCAVWLSTALFICSSPGGCASDAASGKTGESEQPLDGQIAPGDREATSLNPGLDAPARRVPIIAKEFSFSPNQLDARAGEVFTAVLRNEGVHEHSIVFDLPGGHQGPRGTVAPGKSVAFTLRMPTTTGEFPFYCPIGDHRERGMEGIVRVVAPR